MLFLALDLALGFIFVTVVRQPLKKLSGGDQSALQRPRSPVRAMLSLRLSLAKTAAFCRVRAAAFWRHRHRPWLLVHGPWLLMVLYLLSCLSESPQPAKSQVQQDSFVKAGTCTAMESFFKGGYKLCFPGLRWGKQDALAAHMIQNHRNDAVQERLFYSLVRCPLCLSRIHAESHLVLDVGAYAGWFAMWAASVGTTNIHAFEPSTESQQLIRRSIEANGFEEEITLWPVALSSDTEIFHVHTFPDDNNAAFLSKTESEPAQAQGEGEEARKPLNVGTAVSARLDKLLPGEQNIWLMRMSIAGMEDLALDGMMSFLAKPPPVGILPTGIAGSFSTSESKPKLGHAGGAGGGGFKDTGQDHSQPDVKPLPGRIHNILLDCAPVPAEGVPPGRKSSADVLGHLVAQGYHLYSIKHDWDFWVDGMENLGHGIDQQKLITDLLTPFAPNKAITITEFQVVFCTLTVNLKELDVTQVELDYVKTLYTK